MQPGIAQKYPKLRGFAQHGVVFIKTNGNQAIANCPLCGKTQKFYVNIESAVWDCKVCGSSGNFHSFLHQQAINYVAGFKGPVASLLSKDRMLKPQTLRAWGVGWSGNFYSIPANGNGGRKTTDIHRYTLGKGNLSTSGSNKNLIAPKKLYGSKIVWITEGEWDGMALYECLNSLKRKEDVYSVSGAGSFPSRLAEIFYDKDVRIVFDNDDGGFKGAARVAKMLTGFASSLTFVHWPEGFADKFDFRDLYLKVDRSPFQAVKYLEGLLRDKLPETVDDRAAQEETDEKKESYLTGPGMNWEEALAAYRKWLHLPDHEVLDVLFGSIFANRIDVDPCWLFLVAPPGGSKSELLMSLTDAPLIVTTTSLTPHALISGANFAGVGDPSLIPKLNGKSLVIKDFTTILSMNSIARDEIFGTLRDAYDGKTEKHFGNGVTRRYNSKFGIIAGVTPIIEQFSSASVLGERFLKYKIKHAGKINVGEDSIRKALMNIRKENKMREALKEIGKAVLNREIKEEDIPTLSSRMAEKILKLAQWVASLRGVVSRERYTGQINFKPVAEIGTRLAKQLCTIGLGIGIWRGKKTLDDDIYRILVHLAQDTAPDRVEEIVKQMYLRSDQDEWFTAAQIGQWTRFPEATIRSLLEDLMLLHITTKQNTGYKGGWRLTNSILRLMNSLGIYSEEKAWGKTRKVRRLKRRKDK